MHKFSVFPKNPLNHERACNIILSEPVRRFYLPSHRNAAEANMEHKLAQRRLLICAVFFSFGAMSGAMTLMRLSESAISGVKNALVSLVLKGPFLILPAVFLIFPLLMLLVVLFSVNVMLKSLVLILLTIVLMLVEQYLHIMIWK